MRVGSFYLNCHIKQIDVPQKDRLANHLWILIEKFPNEIINNFENKIEIRFRNIKILQFNG
jgi:hypothetical protein